MKFKYFIISFVFVLVIGLLALGLFGFYLLTSAEKNNQQEFVINTGDGVHQISQNLYQQGLIKNQFVFETYVWYKNLEKKFIAGSFSLPPNTNNIDLVKILTSPQAVNQLTLRFIEGWNNDDIADYLLSKGIIQSSAEFNDLTKVNLWQKNYDFLSDLDAQTSLEGYLFPDTYNFFVNVSPPEVIEKMLDNFATKFSLEMRQAAQQQGRSIHDVVKLASLLEKEVKTEADMKLVADIFLRRLALGMLLQADSTLNYATGGKNPSLSTSELSIDSPYNSYKYSGLPPTPISNPGLKALQAALYPTPNDYLFFLTSPDGTVYYAKTFEEHINNRQFLK